MQRLSTVREQERRSSVQQEVLRLGTTVTGVKEGVQRSQEGIQGILERLNRMVSGEEERVVSERRRGGEEERRRGGEEREEERRRGGEEERRRGGEEERRRGWIR